MIITQGATVPLLFPATDSDDNPLDLTTLAKVCFILSGAGSKLAKNDGDDGFEIIDYEQGFNNALLITLSPEETAPLQPGRLYNYWAWGEGDDGTDVIASGEATVIYTERCDD